MTVSINAKSTYTSVIEIPKIQGYTIASMYLTPSQNYILGQVAQNNGNWYITLYNTLDAKLEVTVYIDRLLIKN